MWMASAFSADRRDEVLPVCRFFVEDSLRSKVSKKSPLTAVFRSDVLDPGFLKKKSTRDEWLKTWQKERAKRFVPPPDTYWKK